ncbi:hypothetical protein [Terasakiella pusilla]|uniref:hypothetical protein n=1 Tax=Terasakiella pusilla TaxID=64973 RepID=UPI003AA937DF
MSSTPQGRASAGERGDKGVSEPVSESKAQGLRLARIMRDNARFAAAVDVYAHLEKDNQLNAAETLEYASVAANVMTARDVLPLFVMAKQRIEQRGAMSADEQLVLCLGIGRGQLALQQLEGAIKQLECVLNIDKENVQALNGLGVAYNALNQTEIATDYFTRAQERDPSNLAVRNNLALSWINQGEVEEAIRLLEVESDQRNPTQILNLALAHLLMDDELQARGVLATGLPGVNVDGVLKSLSKRVSRIKGGDAGYELLAASRQPISLDVTE